MSVHQMGTFYVPEGESIVAELPSLRDGNDEGRIVFADDNGTLLLPCYIDEAESEDLLLLKQFYAGRLIGELVTLADMGYLEPGDRLKIRRGAEQVYDLEVLDDGVDEISEAM